MPGFIEGTRKLPQFIHAPVSDCSSICMKLIPLFPRTRGFACVLVELCRYLTSNCHATTTPSEVETSKATSVCHYRTIQQWYTAFEAFYDSLLLRRFTLIFRGSYFLPRYTAELIGNTHIITTDASRISHVYARIMPNNVEHKLHIQPSSAAR